MKKLEMIKGDLKFIYVEHYVNSYNKVFRSVIIKKKRKNDVYAKIRKMNLSKNESFEEFVNSYEI